VFVACEDNLGEKRLVAYFVPKNRPENTVSEIREGLARVLPDYMIPSAFVPIDAIPQTPNGKADRLHLPLPPRERPRLDTAFAPAETSTEKKLADIWAEVLDLEQVGIHDNFFDLGGNSFLATRVSAHVLKKFGVELTINALFESPTVAELTKMITLDQAKSIGDAQLADLLADLKSS